MGIAFQVLVERVVSRLDRNENEPDVTVIAERKATRSMEQDGVFMMMVLNELESERMGVVCSETNVKCGSRKSRILVSKNGMLRDDV